MADHEVWEVRYLLVRVEGVLDQAARGWTPWLEDTLRKELASAADDLELAGTLVESIGLAIPCLLYTSPSPRDATLSRMPSSA